jgi:hypothetical protein
MLTRKGRLRCETCGCKHPKRGGAFLTVYGWAIGPKTAFRVIEPVNMHLADHYCSWECLLENAIDVTLDGATPADICGD